MQHKCSKLLLLGIILALLFSISPSLLAQESTAEPPTPEPPTAEPPTIQPPTPEPPTVEPPTLEPPTLEPPTATEAPSLTATFTETPLPSETPTETPTETASATATLSPTLTPTSTPLATSTPQREPYPFTPAPGRSSFSEDCGVALVNAGDVPGLSAAFSAAWNGMICTIYLNANISPNASEAERTYLVSGGFGIHNALTIHGNNAIIRRTTPGRILHIQPGADAHIHHLTITGANLNGATTDGYGAGVQVWMGTLHLYDSRIVQNTAIHGAGGMDIISGGVVYLERVAVHENYAGGGGGIQLDFGGQLTAECTQFWNNSGGYGVGLLNGNTDNLGSQVTIHNSSFSGNVSVDTQLEQDIFNLLPDDVTINAQQNWWGADGIPNVADSGSGTSIVTSSALPNDPTLPNPVTGLYDVAACEPVPPEPVPPICPQGVMLQNGGVTIQQEICVVPTNTPTPTPTNTPTNTPTPTPIGTITPGMCSITVNIDLALRLSPTRYSPRVATIPLGTALTAVYRVDLQEGGWQEIWYQVNYAGNDGWIAAKIGPDEFANPLTCSLPLPYSNDWQAIAQIESSEIPAGCDIDAYLRSEPAALVLARLAYGEAASFNTTISGGMGGVVYTDATRAAWIARMDAFLGLAYYGQGYAGQSFPIVEEILRRSEVTQQGPFQPLTDLRTELLTNGCNPSAIIDPNKDNVQRMVYPTNRPSASGTVGIAELYELWRIYQEVVNNVINTPWTNMPTDIRGFEQFKGIQSGQPCPSGANNLTRPGSGFTWTANQPYSPQQVYQYIDPAYGGTGGANQSFFTCYQDVYHLDDWFWNVGIGQITDPATSTFPRQFCVVDLVNPGDPEDIYPLAQLRGLDNNPWPPAAPNNPACTFTP